METPTVDLPPDKIERFLERLGNNDDAVAARAPPAGGRGLADEAAGLPAGEGE